MVTSFFSVVLNSVATSFTSVLPRLSFIGSPFSSKIATSTLTGSCSEESDESEDEPEEDVESDEDVLSDDVVESDELSDEVSDEDSEETSDEDSELLSEEVSEDDSELVSEETSDEDSELLSDDESCGGVSGGCGVVDSSDGVELSEESSSGIMLFSGVEASSANARRAISCTGMILISAAAAGISSL